MASDTNEVREKNTKNTFVFNASKEECFTLHRGFKTFTRKLRSTWKLVSNEAEITPSCLAQARVFVTAGPQEKFSQDEFDAMRQFMDEGGSLLVLMREGGEDKFVTNINFFLEEFGINVNRDAVVRLTYLKYFHPKVALVADGILNRAICQSAETNCTIGEDSSDYSQSLSFLYPYGATLNVVNPSTAVLSTGSVCFPINRPVCALYSNETSGGKMAVVGSVHMFSDMYIDKEKNSKILDVLVQYLTTDDVRLNMIDAVDPEISDYDKMPDIATLAEDLKACLQESEEVPKDITILFENSLFKFGTNAVPNSVKAFKTLHVEHKILSPISPKFETPLPRFQPAVFPPKYREIRSPALELFDLDDQLTSEKFRLAQVTNRCKDKDLEFYGRQCGDILGVTSKLSTRGRAARHILEYIFVYVVECKRQNPWCKDSPADRAEAAKSQTQEESSKKDTAKEEAEVLVETPQQPEKETPQGKAAALPAKSEDGAKKTTPKHSTKLPPLERPPAPKEKPEADIELYLSKLLTSEAKAASPEAS